MNVVDKIRKIEDLITGDKSDGERQADEFAKQRFQEKIVAQPIEFTVRLHGKNSCLSPFVASMEFTYLFSFQFFLISS